MKYNYKFYEVGDKGIYKKTRSGDRLLNHPRFPTVTDISKYF